MFLFETKRQPASLFTLLSVSLLLACFAFLTTSITPAHAVTTVPTTMNFQGRLADSSGNIMPDGLYNMQFKLFTVGSGGSSVWNETRENNGSDYRVQVTNGLFSTKLGQVSPLSASLFASGSLYFEITMATPATATCSTASCASWESPMTPRHEMSTSAYAYNAETLDGYDSSYFATATGATGYIQNTTTPQTADFNITGTGTAATLRASTFDTASAGTLTVGGTNATSISLADDTTLASGKTLRVVGDTYTNIDGYPSPTEGQITYDQTNDQLLVYNATLGKWMSDKSDAILVAASNSSQADKNAADYVADGIADQVEINSALTAGAGKKVVLLAGTYTASATILVPNNTTLAGVGAGTLIQLADIDVTDNLIENSDTTTGTGVVIRDLKLDGQKSLNTAGTQNGIYFNGMGSGSGVSAVKGGLITNVTVELFRFNGILLVNSSNNSVFDNLMISNNNRGIALEGSSNNNSVVANKSQGSGYYGIALYLSSHNTVTDNTLLDDNDFGIGVDESSYNIINNNTIDTAGVYGTAINLYRSANNVVSANNIEGNDGGGISVGSTGSNNNNITGNRIHDSSGATDNDGIVLWTDGDANVIANNLITDTSATDTNNAIKIRDANIENTYLTNNRFSSTAGTSIINDAGTGTVYSNQPLAENGGSITTRTANSTTAFQVQNASGANILTADTTNGEIEIGSASLAGKLAISDGSSNTATITVGALAGNYTVTIPTITGNDTFCLESKSNCADGGVTAVGALDGGTANATGATITDTTIYLQSASASYGGLVNTSTQTFAGAKTFNDSITLAAAKTVTMTGGTTANRPASPTEGMIYYDTTTKQLLTYANGKWQGDSKTASFIVAASNSSQAVKDGAQYVADGTADEVEINAAIAALPANNGIVYLTEGTYNLSARVNMNRGGVKLIGSGYGTLLTRQFNSASAEGLVHITVSNVTIQNLRINGNKATYTSGNNNNLRIVGGTKQRIVNNWLYDSAGSNLLTGGYEIGADSVIKDNEIYGSSYRGIDIDSSPRAILANNLIYSNTGAGIYVSSQTWRISITGNTIQNNTYAGIDSNAVFPIISSNYINGNNDFGIRASNRGNINGNTVTYNVNGILVGNGNEHVNVVSNVVANNSSLGIEYDNGTSSSANIESNYIYDNGGYGISLKNTPSNVTVTGNRLHNNSGSGSDSSINVGGSSTTVNVKIVGNHITDTAGSGHAINLSSANIIRAYLADNTYSGTGASTINDAGTDTIYASQLSAANILQSASTSIRAGASGTITGTAATNGTTTLTGTGTSFLSKLQVGDRITVNAQTKTITAITSNTSLTVDSAFSGTGSGYTITRLPAALVVANSSSVNTFMINDIGSATLRNSTDSTTAFQLQNASGENLMTVNTTDNYIEFTNLGASTGGGIKISSPGNDPGIELYGNNGNRADIRRTSNTLFLGVADSSSAPTVGFYVNGSGDVEANGDITGVSDRFWARYETSSAFGLELGDRAGTNTTNYIDFHTDGSSGTDYNSRIRANAGSNSLLLYSSGGQTCTLSSSWSCTSDKTLKNITGNVTDNLERITQLQPVYFNWKSDPTQTIQIGLVAQDVQEQYPELVITNDDGELSLNYQGLVAPLIGAVKEQQAQIEQTQTMVASLQGGGIENGGAISGNLTVSGDTILTNLNVNGVTTLAGLVAVGTAQVQTLDVIGSAKVQGELTVTGATNVKDIYVNGHIVSIGEKPTITTGEALGSIGSDVVIDGTDSAGTVTVTAGAENMSSGVLAKITFADVYEADVKVVVSASNESASEVRTYTVKTATGFEIVAKDQLQAGAEYAFDYIVQGVKVVP